MADPGSPERSPTVAGHPSISWSIVLDAGLRATVTPSAVQGRLVEAWPGDGRAGPPPTVGEVPVAELAECLADAADRPFVEGEPLCRVVVARADRDRNRTRIVVAGHHAVLDGLGLVAVLGAAVGEPLGTSARGADPSRLRGAGFVHVARRAIEALVAPPSRIAPDADGPAVAAAAAASPGGDHLVRSTVARPVTSAELVAAAAAAVRRWNGPRSEAAGRIVVAVGASSVPGAAASIGRQAMWFRIRVGEWRPDEVRRAIRARGPEPRESASIMRAVRRSGISRILERRTGSTLLVSNLGSIEPAAAVSDLAFFPSGHGRSGVAVGAVALGGVTTVTVRARREDFSRRAAQELADLVAAFAERPPL